MSFQKIKIEKRKSQICQVKISSMNLVSITTVFTIFISIIFVFTSISYKHSYLQVLPIKIIVTSLAAMNIIFIGLSVILRGYNMELM